VLDAESASRRLPRVFTRYDDLLSDWRVTADRIADALGVSWPRRSISADLEIGTFLSPDHRHNVETDQRIFEDSHLSPWIRETYDILGRWARDDMRDTDLLALDRIRVAFDDAVPAFAGIVRTARDSARRVRQLKKEADRLRAETAEARNRVVKADEALQASRANLDASRHRLAETESTLAQRLHEAEESAAQFERVRSDLQSAVAKAETLRVEMQHVKANVEKLKAEKQVAEDRLAERFDEIVTLTRLFQDKEADSDRLRAEHVAELEALRADSDRLRAEHAAELKGLRADSDRLRAEHAAELKGLRVDSDRLQAEHAAELEGLRADSDRMRRAASDRLTGAVGALLDGQRWWFLPKPFRIRLKVAQLKRSGLFDGEWYVKEYADVAAAGMDPLRHYVVYGAKEGRQPNPVTAAATSAAKDITSTPATSRQVAANSTKDRDDD
jgi:hypothetical protein